jgi:hypothetical protein
MQRRPFRVFVAVGLACLAVPAAVRAHVALAPNPNGIRPPALTTFTPRPAQ